MSGYTDITKMENSRNCLRRIARHDEQQFSKESIVHVMEKFVKTVNAMDETILVPCRLMDRQVGDSTDIIQAPTKNSTSNQLTLSTFNANGKPHKKRSKNVHEFLSSAELFNLYNMLNTVKNDLLWNRDDADEDEDEGIASNNPTTVGVDDNSSSSVHSPSATRTDLATNNTPSTSSSATLSTQSSTGATATNTTKGHIRRPSTASMTSTTSVSNLSDSESEISNENDSGIESEGNSQKGENQTKPASSTDKATDLARQYRRHLTGLYQCLEQMTEAANYLTARYQSDIGSV